MVNYFRYVMKLSREKEKSSTIATEITAVTRNNKVEQSVKRCAITP